MEDIRSSAVPRETRPARMSASEAVILAAVNDSSIFWNASEDIATSWGCIGVVTIFKTSIKCKIL